MKTHNNPVSGVSSPLVINSDASGVGRETLRVPFDMVVRTVRAFTKDPAGLRVARLKISPTGTSTINAGFWSPLDESTDLGVPLYMLVAPDDRPNEPCPLTGWRLKGGSKWTFETIGLEGQNPYSVELVFIADPACD